MDKALGLVVGLAIFTGGGWATMRLVQTGHPVFAFLAGMATCGWGGKITYTALTGQDPFVAMSSALRTPAQATTETVPATRV